MSIRRTRRGVPSPSTRNDRSQPGSANPRPGLVPARPMSRSSSSRTSVFERLTTRTQTPASHGSGGRGGGDGGGDDRMAATMSSVRSNPNLLTGGVLSIVSMLIYFVRSLQDIVSLSSAQAKRSKIQFLSNYFRDVPVDVQVAMAHAIRCVQYADKHLNSNHVSDSTFTLSRSAFANLKSELTRHVAIHRRHWPKSQVKFSLLKKELCHALSDVLDAVRLQYGSSLQSMSGTVNTLPIPTTRLSSSSSSSSGAVSRPRTSGGARCSPSSSIPLASSVKVDVLAREVVGILNQVCETLTSPVLALPLHARQKVYQQIHANIHTHTHTLDSNAHSRSPQRARIKTASGSRRDKKQSAASSKGEGKRSSAQERLWAHVDELVRQAKLLDFFAEHPAQATSFYAQDNPFHATTTGRSDEFDPVKTLSTAFQAQFEYLRSAFLPTVQRKSLVENLQGVLNRLFDLVIAKVRKTSARKRLDEAILAGDVILLEGAIESARRSKLAFEGEIQPAIAFLQTKRVQHRQAMGFATLSPREPHALTTGDNDDGIGQLSPRSEPQAVVVDNDDDCGGIGQWSGSYESDGEGEVEEEEGGGVEWAPRLAVATSVEGAASLDVGRIELEEEQGLQRAYFDDDTDLVAEGDDAELAFTIHTHTHTPHSSSNCSSTTLFEVPGEPVFGSSTPLDVDMPLSTTSHPDTHTHNNNNNNNTNLNTNTQQQQKRRLVLKCSVSRAPLSYTHTSTHTHTSSILALPVSPSSTLSHVLSLLATRFSLSLAPLHATPPQDGKADAAESHALSLLASGALVLEWEDEDLDRIAVQTAEDWDYATFRAQQRANGGSVSKLRLYLTTQ